MRDLADLIVKLQILGIPQELKRLRNLAQSVGSTTSSAVQSFLGLNDTPDTFAGQGNKIVRVKADETGLEFATGGAGVTDHGDLSGLSDDDHAQYLLTSGSRAMGGNLDMDDNQILSMRIENVGVLPAGGNAGRLVFFNDDDHLYLDQG